MPDTDPTTRLTVTGPDGAVHDLPSTEAQDVIDALPAPELREWGHRYWDGSAGPDESREAALQLARRFKPGAVELVHRAGPDAEWVRAGYQPHAPSERLDELAAHIAFVRRISDWRGQRLAELGEYPNPPKDWHPIAPGQDAMEDLPLALEATCAPHAVVTSHGGEHWHVTHPAACDRLPYGVSCMFDEARELRGYEQEPPSAAMFIGTPYVAHDHGDGECVRRDCPVLIRWSAAQDRETPGVAKPVRHVQPGVEGDAPEHPGRREDCPHPVCVTSRRQHEAADAIQDLTAELFPDDAPGGAR